MNFNSEKLINECIKNLDEGIYIPAEKLIYDKKKIAITKGGIEETGAYEIEENLEITTKYKLPDITYLFTHFILRLTKNFTIFNNSCE